ncbi:MAG: AIR synthase-related protein, partial [Longimicrobiales bacterium]
VAAALLSVHRSYLREVTPLLDESLVRAMAHITGGGIEGNLPRVLPEGLGARIDTGTWEIPPVFQTLAKAGGVEAGEMFRVFNMGVGRIVVVRPEDAAPALDLLGGEAWRLGEITSAPGVHFSDVQ